MVSLQIKETKGFFQSSDEELFVSPCTVTIFKCVRLILSSKKERIRSFCGVSLCKYLVDTAHVSFLFVIHRRSSRLFFPPLKGPLSCLLIDSSPSLLPFYKHAKSRNPESPAWWFQPDRRKSAKNINNRKLHEVSPSKRCCPLSFETAVTAREWPGGHLAPLANKINQWYAT